MAAPAGSFSVCALRSIRDPIHGALSLQMNRRGFLRSLATVAAGFTVLPAATTYARRWVAGTPRIRRAIINPEWLRAEWELHFVADPRDFGAPFMMWRQPKDGEPATLYPVEIKIGDGGRVLQARIPLPRYNLPDFCAKPIYPYIEV